MRLLKRSETESAKRDFFLQTVQSHLGYLSELGGRNKFGLRVGYDSMPWSGAFIDVCARDAGIPNFPSFVNSSAGAAEALRRGSDYRVPEPGDIVIFNFSSMIGPAAGAFNMPHCGVVTDTREFLENGKFITVEGNTDGATANLKKDGVHQKIRHMTDVMLFYRPDFQDLVTFNERLMQIFDRARTRFTKEETEEIEELARVPLILKLNGDIKYGTRNKRVEIIQVALALVTDLRGAEPGKWDSSTAAACSRFQRNIGRTGKDVTGLPDVSTLKRLSQDTKVFIIDE